ncbi:3-methyl-2-oxobutanoate dehydrogenase subunit VorB [Sedimentibacter hydroxybenzoicus]
MFMKGNEAIAESAIRSGCKAYYGYPITPQNELTAYMAKNMKKLGRVFIQTESEITAINAVFGSAVAGFRAMTSSAGTAMALKQEGISHLAYLEIPAVIVDMMRGGPGLGNILATQGDYNMATKGGGTGDYHVIVLAPNSVQEASDLTRLAFELADKYRNPAMILADGTIGQMIENVEFMKPIAPEDLPTPSYALTGCEGRAPRKAEPKNSAQELEEHNIALQRKYDICTANEQRFEEIMTEDAEVILVAFGSVSRMAHEIIAEAREEGYKLGLFRPITLWPFAEGAFKKIIHNAKAVVVLEHNAGMLTRDIRMYVNEICPVYYHGRMGGSIIDMDVVSEKIKSIIDNNGKDWRELDGQQGLWKTY